jgi:hypothetical protein
MALIAATTTTAAAVATVAATAAEVWWRRGGVGSAGMMCRVSSDGGRQKIAKSKSTSPASSPFGDFTQQRGAMFLTLS